MSAPARGPADCWRWGRERWPEVLWRMVEYLLETTIVGLFAFCAMKLYAAGHVREAALVIGLLYGYVKWRG